MKTLNISGKELALSLHIDETLVSKYKNNKRCLSKEIAFEISRYIAEYHAKEPSLFFRLTRNILEPYAEKSLEACTDYYYNMLNEIKQNAHLILKKIKIHQQYLITKKLEYELQCNNSVYMLDSVFTYRNMLDEVLEKNNINDSLKETIIDSYNWWQKFYSTYKIKCIFDIEEINKNHKLDKVKDYELSAMAGRDIYIGKYQFEKHIRHVLYNKEYKNFKSAYYPFSKYLKQLWESLPNIHKNKDSFFERTLTDDDSMNF